MNQSSPDIPAIRIEDVEAAVAFLPTFSARDFSPGHWESPPGVFPYFCADPAVGEFLKQLYDHHWVVDLDWPSQQDWAQQRVADPTLLRTATLDEIRMLLTTHARKDRFCDGHLAEMLGCGHIRAVLERLREIRATFG